MSSALTSSQPGADPEMRAKRLLGRLWREHVSDYWKRMLLALGLMTIEGATLGAAAYLIQPLFDEVLVTGDGTMITWAAFAIAGILLLKAIAGFGQRLIIVSIGLKVVIALQSRLLNHLLSLDGRFFQDNAPGALIERVRGDTSALQSLASTALMSAGRDTISLISLLTVMFLNDWTWTLLALVGVPLMFFPVVLLQRLIRGFTMSAREAASRLSTQMDEIFHGMQSIKVNRLEAHQSREFRSEVGRFLGQQMRAERSKAGTPAMVDVMAALACMLVLLVGGAEIVAGEKTVGQFMSFFTALALVMDPVRRLSSLSASIQAALASLQRIYEVLNARPTILNPATPKPLSPGDIVFDDVHFAYGDAPVLNGLSFRAAEGRTTALVGPSGAGKSTVFGLMTRLIDPVSGRITIGDTATTEAELDRLRDSIAVVGQETALFDQSIAQNIRLGRLDASEAEIRAAAEAASVTDFADALPGGLETTVGPRGSTLSGGQRQRVAIARAMLRDAPILLLDEPTSALDAKSEQLVQEALTRLSHGRTTLVIAHRLSTIRDADLIVVMDKGRVVEEGTHASLMAAEGAYARLHALQSAGVTTAL
ncbi:ABC transporter ATP-binding protein [Rhodophyticola porphyridii]|uniref:ABC transporter ATP-binding protein n=1 Tax=Rhodophyticola porphyridii TaxID=1852017 RepID=A0A3L9Y3Y2_9RHOB|nr:ABC transporter ATP-binding protein [Rhodophyticola porphyridii]RMA41003.1 ABC transporter ATP-binding protein [Rhodophyticola porphyridii]